MIYPAKIFFIVFSCAAAATVVAETLYKSVNEQGEVTFSDAPPENAAKVQQIQVKPAPTEQQHREALERENLIQQEGQRLGAANAERSKAREDQAPRQTNNDVEPIETYNMDYRNRPGRPLPEHRLRPAPLPVTRPINRPVQRPAR